MNAATRFISKLPVLSLLALFPCLILSYLPVIALGAIRGLHIDLSLLYALLGIVIVSNMPFIFRSFARLRESIIWQILALFVVYVWASATWSTNSVRAVATAGFLTALFLLSTVIMLRIPELKKRQRQLTRYSLVALALSCIWAGWQIIGDMFGILPTFTALPTMYAGSVFGVARPTAFALEPQFFGSLLLVPVLWACWHIVTRSKDLRVYSIIFVCSLTVLVLTLSRGALFAALGGFIVLLACARPPITLLLKTFLFGIASIAVALGIVYIAGSLRNDTISGHDAVAKAINQLSLGTINLKPSSAPLTTPKNPSPQPAATPSSGYVESSTISRLTMTDNAVQLWKQSPQTLLFGVGIGGFGSALMHKDPTYPIGSIVGNYYAELLVETGVLGFLLFMGFAALLLWNMYQTKQWLLLALVSAFFIQWCFFSGNANVVHVWVVLGVCLGLPTKWLRINTVLCRKIHS